MAITIFIVAGAVVSLTALFVMATQVAARPALAGDNTVVGLADAAAETQRMGASDRANTQWQLTTVDDLSRAEDVLDSLEACGFADRELIVLGNSCFAIRYR
jgi:hypothetical protein